MRLVLLSLVLLAVAADAQPVVSTLGAERPAFDQIRLVSGETSPFYRGAVASAMGTAGAMAVGGSAALATGLIVLGVRGCGFDGCPGPEPDFGALVTTVYVIGGAVGSTLLLRMVSQSRPDPRGLLPDLGLDADDWRRGVVGTIVGTGVGVGVALLVGEVRGESGAEWLAVPIAQGLGAGVAIAL